MPRSCGSRQACCAAQVIDRNVKRAMDPTTAASKELMYEAYGVGGVGLIVNCLSDNNNRATMEVNTIVKKNSCNIASSGSVAFNFARKGRLTLNKEITEDDLLELAIDAGCDGDVTVEAPDPDGRGDGDEVKCVVLTEQTELGLVQSALLDAGFECSGQLVHVPLSLVDCSEEDMELNYAAIDKVPPRTATALPPNGAPAGTRRLQAGLQLTPRSPRALSAGGARRRDHSRAQHGAGSHLVSRETSRASLLARV